jgi:hypothetical protein
LIAAKRALTRKQIFVFGSDETGWHGKGAALWARKHHGAVNGQGHGPQGNSKDQRHEPLPLVSISRYIHLFLSYAAEHPDLEFRVTRIGCGSAGYSPDQIKPLFWQDGFIPKNVS